MGLDMYLKASRYYSGFKHSKDSEFDRIRKNVGLDPTSDHPSITATVTVGYWRKANAIHKWFVDNVQGGDDDCQEHDVSRGDLENLLSVCCRVMGKARLEDGVLNCGKTYHADGRVDIHTEPGKVVANAEEISKILPTASGFFFGCTDYDEGYINDVRETIEIIERVLRTVDLNKWDLTYQSSW